MSLIEIVLVLYCALLLSGAYFGWKVGSKVSMIMGVVSGLLVLYGIYLIPNDPSAGYNLITAVSGILSVVFAIRLIKTRKFMPAGMLLGASILIFLLNLIQIL